VLLLLTTTVDGASSKQLQFSTLTAQDVVKISEFQVTHRDLYTTTDRAPVKDGVLDRRLVRLFPSSCLGSAYMNCIPAGYVGEERVLRDLRSQCGRLRRSLRLHKARRPRLSYRVFQAYNRHPSMHLQGNVLTLHDDSFLNLQQTCARVLLEEPERRMYLRRFRRPNLENVQRQSLFKAVNTAARKTVYCPYCAATNGAVKKAGALKIIHDKFRAKKTAEEMEAWKKTFASAVEAQKELGLYINKAVHEDLNPLKVLDLFRRISNEASSLIIGFFFTLLI
jgi:DNA-directed RNA polymerase III subunit RPC1